MNTQTIRHAYNEVVAPHYDRDPQGVTGNSLDRAVRQIRKQGLLGDGAGPLRVLDVGMGTGMFLVKLKALGNGQVQPYGLDLAEQMLAEARRKVPDLVAEVDDAANLDAHFPGQTFDLVSSHFITGFVPLRLLAPKVWGRLEEGGHWSLVGGTLAGYPALQAKANSRFLRWLSGAGTRKIDDVVCNPADQAEAVRTLEAHGFEVCAAETFEPALRFRDFDEFMEFAYTGGWLTPLIEATGLHRAGAFKRWLLNRFVFPVHDRHSIVIVLARKVSK
jgi:ubiquinone/menaquinone biosynthesis C-methylase UbiE